MPFAKTTADQLTPCREFPILIEGLWSGDVSERQFVGRCAELGIAYETVQATLNQLRAEDGVL